VDRLIELHRQLARDDGYTDTAVAEVRLTRATQSVARTPVMSEPCIAIALQGRKRAFFGTDVLQFDADQYLVVAIPMPFSSATEATPEKPFLGLTIQVDRTTLADLMFAIDQSDNEVPAAPKGMMTTRMDARLRDTVLRLLETLGSPLEARVLGPAIVREICFRVLMGEQGAAMRAALTGQGQFGRIAKALRRIHSDYAASIDVGIVGCRSQHERARVPCAFQIGDALLADPVREVGAAAPGPPAYGAQRHDRAGRVRPGRLRERVAIQPRVQALFRTQPQPGSRCVAPLLGANASRDATVTLIVTEG
jgi:hypothetical protein